MKECKYCGSKYRDELDSCPNCGGNLIVTAEELSEAAELQKKEKENQQRSVVEPQDQIKKLIGIAAGVVAAIVVIVVVASYAHNHRPVNGDFSRADMAEAYEQGVAYYNSKDYASAIAELGKVSAESKYYDEASAMLQEAVAIYSDDALSKASTYASTGDYKMACSILENALQVIPANSALTEELASYQETFRDQLRTSTLEAVEGSIAEDDYPAAIQTLSAALDELSGDIELNALLEKYSGEYRDMIITQADAALESEGYEAAIAVANQGLVVLNNDSTLLQAIANYETYRPVNITTLKIVGQNAADYTDNAEDIAGNVYEHAFSIGGNSPGYKGYNYIEFATSGEYSHFSAILSPADEWKWRQDFPTCTIKVFGDDKTLATYTVNYKDAPKQISVDVTDVSYLEIRMTAGSMWCEVLLIDASVSK